MHSDDRTSEIDGWTLGGSSAPEDVARPKTDTRLAAEAFCRRARLRPLVNRAIAQRCNEETVTVHHLPSACALLVGTPDFQGLSDDELCADVLRILDEISFNKFAIVPRGGGVGPTGNICAYTLWPSNKLSLVVFAWAAGMLSLDQED